MDKMTENSNLFKMSIPIFIEMLLQLLVGNIDQIMVGWYSNESVAAIVNGNQIMNLIITSMNVLCMATTIMLTQYLGAKDRQKSNQICMISTIIMGGLGLMITFISLFFSRPIFCLMNIDPLILDETCTYLMIVGGAAIFQALHMNFVAILRSHTFMKEVMGVSVFMNCLNVIGNTVLINGLAGFPQMGVTGAAVSTALSKIAGLIAIIILFKKYTEVELRFKYLTSDTKEMIGKYMKIGLPTGAENVSYHLSQAFVLGIINPYGAIVTAAKGYCSILANVSYLYGGSIAQALQIVVGYLLGSKNIEEIEKKVWWTTKVSILVSSGFMLILWVFSDYTLGIFTQDPTILSIGRQVLFFDVFLEAGRSINNTMTKTFVTVGEIKLPIVVGISFQWIVGVGLAFVFGSVLELGLSGVWLAMMCDECLRGLIFVIVFHKNKWKEKCL